jgi:AraC family transcriptional regulator
MQHLTESAVDTARSKFRKVLEYIDAHPDDELSVDRLSNVAAFSKYH